MRFAADENFNNDILRGLRRHYPDLDVIRIQDTEIVGAEDEVVLEWALKTDRILLTHDRKTIPPLCAERYAAGLAVPGILMVKSNVSHGAIIEDLALVLGASEADEWFGKVTFIPF